MATIEVSRELYESLDEFFYALPRPGLRIESLIQLLELMDNAFIDEAQITLPGPDGEPNVEVPIADFSDLTRSFDA